MVTITGEWVRTSLHKINGCYMMAVNKDVQQQIGSTAGDTVQVTVSPDQDERPIEVPDDLVDALTSAGRRADFDGLTPFRQNQLITSVTGATRPETRARRLDAAVSSMAAELAAGK